MQARAGSERAVHVQVLKGKQGEPLLLVCCRVLLHRCGAG